MFIADFIQTIRGHNAHPAGNLTSQIPVTGSAENTKTVYSAAVARRKDGITVRE